MVRSLGRLVLESSTIAALAVAAARAQTPAAPPTPASAPAPTPSAPTPAVPAPAREKPTLESLRLVASDLPTTEWKFTDELLTASPAAKSLATTGTIEGLGTTATRQQFQSITAPSGAGSLVSLEFPADVDDATFAKLCNAFWGEKHRPAVGHAELLARSGAVVIVLAFPPTSSIRDWICRRLRPKYLLRLPDESDERRKKLEPIKKWFDADKCDLGIKAFEENKAAFADCSAAHVYLAQFHNWKGENQQEVDAYARALELDATVDPFQSDQELFAVLYQRGNMLHEKLKKYDQSVPVLDRAAQVAGSFGDPLLRADALYNKCCGLCLQKKFDGVVAALKECFVGDPRLVENAKRDHDLDALKNDPDYQKLFEGAKQ